MTSSPDRPVLTAPDQRAAADNSPDQMARARDWLAERDAALAHAHAATPPVSWRRRPGGYGGLIRMVVEQQVSIASAAAIWRRVEAGLGVVTPENVLALEEVDLRSLGLSAPKARYVRSIAMTVAEGRFDFDALGAMEDPDAVAALTALTGIGRWTAEIYMMFCHGRMDVFPAGDIALQEALRAASGHPVRLTEKALNQHATGWRPYRSVAAHLLWAYYGVLKRGEARPYAPD